MPHNPTNPEPNALTTSSRTSERSGTIHHTYDLGELDSYQYVTFTIGDRRVMLWTFADSEHPSVDVWTVPADGNQDSDRLPARLVSGLSNTAALTWDAGK